MVAFMLPPAQEAKRAKVSTIPPEYPELARLLGIGGSVRLAVTVDCVGRVIRVEILSGEPLLLEAACEAARRWRFSPGTGQATVDIEMNFPPASTPQA